MNGFLSSHNLDVAVLMNRGAALIDAAQKAGADAADAVIMAGRSLSVSVLDGKVEEHENAEGDDFGLRVFIGKKQAVVSGNTVNDTTIAEMAQRAVAMAKAASENPFAGLPDDKELAHLIPHLDMFDPTILSSDQLIEHARAAEAAACSVKGVSKSSGASANANHGSFMLLSSNGFAGAYATSLYSVSVTAIAGEGTQMERDYDYSSKRHYCDLRAPDDIGVEAGTRAVRRLNGKKIASGKQKLIFDKRIVATLLGHLAQAINGAAIASKHSFLNGALGTQLFNDAITISDDPHRARGFRSRPFDGEGVRTQKRNIIERGLLTSWLLDCASARELNMKSTGHAERGISSTPSPASTNFILQSGTHSVEQLCAEISNGIYVTDLIGRGANMITGDYSCGFSGLLIENGEITTPVTEITMAGKLQDMFAALIPANDLEIRSSIAGPTCYVGEMMVAGR